SAAALCCGGDASDPAPRSLHPPRSRLRTCTSMRQRPSYGERLTGRHLCQAATCLRRHYPPQMLPLPHVTLGGVAHLEQKGNGLYWRAPTCCRAAPVTGRGGLALLLTSCEVSARHS